MNRNIHTVDVQIGDTIIFRCVGESVSQFDPAGGCNNIRPLILIHTESQFDGVAIRIRQGDDSSTIGVQINILDERISIIIAQPI